MELKAAAMPKEYVADGGVWVTDPNVGLRRLSDAETAERLNTLLAESERLTKALRYQDDRLDRKAMALICMKWRLDCDQGDWPEDKARECMAAISGPHYGDCTNAPITCLRCEAEAAFRQADAIISHIQGGENAE